MLGITITRPAIIGAVVGAGAAALLALATADAAPAHCTAGKTIATDSYARVYGNSNDSVVACIKATGVKRQLGGASASTDHFALAGKWVAWTSSDTSSTNPAHSIVNLMHISDGSIPNQFPFDTNDAVKKVVVKSDGASAWAAKPSDYPNSLRYVQGFDRSNHPPDSLSDDTKDVKPASLTSLPGHAISWKYTDGSSGTANLF